MYILYVLLERVNEMRCKACNKEIPDGIPIKCPVCGWPDISEVIKHFDKDGKREYLDMRFRLLKYFLDQGWVDFVDKASIHGGNYIHESNMINGIFSWWLSDEIGNQVYLLWNTIMLSTAQAMHQGKTTDIQLRGVYTNPYAMFRDKEEIEEENREQHRNARVYWTRRLTNHPYGASMFREMTR